jgi:hypothetical protein
MSKANSMVPEDMLDEACTVPHDPSVSDRENRRAILNAALCWLINTNMTPDDEQMGTMLMEVTHEVEDWRDMGDVERMQFLCGEWVSRLFLRKKASRNGDLSQPRGQATIQ